jgi:putative redox protein
MEVLIRHLGASQFEIRARNHTVFCDQPAENGGFDEGMTPPEFMLASLGACAGYYAAEYLRTRHLPEAGLQVRVTAEKGGKPPRLAAFWIEIEVPPGLEERHRQGVLRAARACLIHNTLLASPEVHVRLAEERQTPMAA